MKILFIPIDDRPCSVLFPAQFSQMADFDITIPPKELLGRFMTPGNPAALLSWIEESTDFDTAVLSLDMLVYGGLVASRSIKTKEPSVYMKRFENWLKTRQDKRNIIFSTIMRTLPTLTDNFILSQSNNLKKALAGIYPEKPVSKLEIEENLKKELKKDTPYKELLKNCLKAREIKHKINLDLITLKKQGLLDIIIFGLDDVLCYGPNTYEKREIESLTNGLNNSFIYTGTDEIPMVIIAKLVLEQNVLPPSFKIYYSNPQSKDHKTIYENSSVPEIINGFLNFLNLKEAKDNGDINLFCHISKKGQKETEFQKISPSGHEAKFAVAVARSQKEGKFSAVADIAYANGADVLFTKNLMEKVDVVKLGGYAAWNTAGNTLGTVIAQSIIRYVSLEKGKQNENCEKAHHLFIFERFIDDFVYQSIIRAEYKLKFVILNKSMLNMNEDDRLKTSAKIEKKLIKYAKKLFKKKYEGVHSKTFASSTVCRPLLNKPNTILISHPFKFEACLPWGRLFEAEIKTDFKLKFGF